VSARPSKLELFDEIQVLLTDSYTVKGLLSTSAMSVVYGPSNSGKTFLALDLTFHIAADKPWNGRRVKQAAVLYLAAEGGRGIVNRIAALRSEYPAICGVPL
jgi:RecA-family ATPase